MRRRRAEAEAFSSYATSQLEKGQRINITAELAEALTHLPEAQRQQAET